MVIMSVIATPAQAGGSNDNNTGMNNMNQRLVWNFEFSQAKPRLPAIFKKSPKETIKWEVRCFWPENHVVTLHNIDANLLKLSHYELEVKEDIYYLLPDNNFNIKRRGN